MSWITVDLIIFVACVPGLCVGWVMSNDENRQNADIAVGVLLSSVLVMLLCAGIYIGRMVL